MLIDDVKKYYMEITTLTIFVNLECNLDCAYCFVDKNKDKLFWSDDIKKFISDLMINTNKLDIILFGGEPLLNFDFIKEIILFKEKFNRNNLGKQINILGIPTNGTIYKYDMYKFLYNHNIELEFSIDNFLTNEIDKYRIHKSVKDYKLYNVIKKNFENYIKIYGKAPGVSITINDSNINILFNLLKYFIEDLNVKFVSLSHLISKKNFIDYNSFKIFKREYLKIVNYYYKNIINTNVIIEPFEDMLNLYLDSHLQLDKFIDCSIGTSEIFLGTNGLIYNCSSKAASSSNDENFIFGSYKNGINYEKLILLNNRILNLYNNSEKKTFSDKININKMHCLKKGYKKDERNVNKLLYEYIIKVPYFFMIKYLINN